MATANPSKVESLRAALLVREDTHFLQYKGTADQLAAAGFIEHDQLPGMPGRRKTREYYDLPNGRRIGVFPAGKTKFDLYVYRSDEERDYLRAEAKAAEEIAKLPKTKKAYRQSSESARSLYLAGFFNVLTRPSGGFHYQESTLAALRGLFGKIDALMASAPVEFDRDLLEREIASIREEAGCDPAETTDVRAPLHLVANNVELQQRGNHKTPLLRLATLRNGAQEGGNG